MMWFGCFSPQCVEEVERLTQQKQPQPDEMPTGPGNEEDDIEELEEEEEFGTDGAIS